MTALKPTWAQMFMPSRPVRWAMTESTMPNAASAGNWSAWTWLAPKSTAVSTTVGQIGQPAGEGALQHAPVEDLLGDGRDHDDDEDQEHARRAGRGPCR